MNLNLLIGHTVKSNCIKIFVALASLLIIQCCYADDIQRAEDRCNNLQIQIQEKIQDLDEIKDACITKEELEDLLAEYRAELNSIR